MDAKYVEAIERCQSLLNRAQKIEINEPMATALATSDAKGHATARMVLLRGFDSSGFVFYTNSQSRKGGQLSANPRAALCFYWDAIREQLRAEGTIEKVSDDQSDTYWASRPQVTQISSVVSQQSRVLENREAFEAEVSRMERKYAGRAVPRPDHWFGYRVVPDRIEFWTGREQRMHERTVYEKTENGWVRYLLYP